MKLVMMRQLTILDFCKEQIGTLIGTLTFEWLALISLELLFKPTLNKEIIVIIIKLQLGAICLLVAISPT